MSVHLSLDLANVMQSRVGRQHGISQTQIAALQRRTTKIHHALQQRRHSGELAFYDLPYMRESIIEVMSYAAEQIGRFENYVHVGIGGFTLGPRALHSALNHPFHNYFTTKDRGGYPRLFFVEHVDPDSLSGLLDIIDTGETLFNIVSKSGSTVETNASFLIFLAALKKRLGSGWKNQVVFTTDPENGDLHAIARAEHIKSFAIHPMAGEHFSVLAPVGLLPAAISGIDVHGLLLGASEMATACQSEDIFKNPAYLFAAAHYLLNTRKGKSIALMMSHADCLADLTVWFRQLWTASVEKKLLFHDKKGFSGKTPEKTLEAAGQRTRQLFFAEGTNDKVITFINVGKFRHDVLLPAAYGEYESFRSLGGKTANQLVQTGQRATAESLTAAQRPNLTITFPAVRPETVGEFIFMMEVVAAYAGELYAVDALDQPRVKLD